MKETHKWDGNHYVPTFQVLHKQMMARDKDPKQIKDVVGDGNCQARAIVAALEKDSYKDYKALKAAALNYLDSHEKNIQSILTKFTKPDGAADTSRDWQARLRFHLRNEGNAGDANSIALYATMLKCPIQVYDALSGSLLLNVTPPQSEHQLIELGYRQEGSPGYNSNFEQCITTEGHYAALIPLSTAKQGNGLASEPARRKTIWPTPSAAACTLARDQDNTQLNINQHQLQHQQQ